MRSLYACSPPAGPRLVRGHIVTPFRVRGVPRTRGSWRGAAPSSSSALTPSAAARAGTWSSASRRLPASRRLSVEVSMLARSATCWRVRPCSVRSSRRRRRARASTGSGSVGFAISANHLGRSLEPCHRSRMDRNWDCIVVGGGAAGLSAALVLGRARRTTLVVDGGRQSNLAAHGIGGLLGHDGRPADLYAAGREELAAYATVELRAGEIAAGERDEAGFTLELADGTRERARRVLLATGMEYRYPALPGIAERWGRSVFHCPFCHGWEVREQALGVLDRGAEGARRALLLRSWSDDVTLFADGPAELGAEEAAHLEAAGVAIDERRVAELRGPGGSLTGIGFADGTERAVGA